MIINLLIRSFGMIFGVCAILAFAGCAAPRKIKQDDHTFYGGYVTVKIESKPKEATAYLIGMSDWYKYGKSELLLPANREVLQKFKLSQKTPLSSEVREKKYILVLEKEKYKPFIEEIRVSTQKNENNYSFVLEALK